MQSEPTEEMTPELILHDRILDEMRSLVKAVREQEDPDLQNRLRGQLRNLVDPPEEGPAQIEEPDALLALAQRYSSDEGEKPDPKKLVKEVRAALAGDNDYSKHLPEPVVGDEWDKKDPPREWLVKDWLPAGELALLSGPGNVGKSLLVLQLACALATEREVTSWIPKDKDTKKAEALTPESGGVTVVLANWEDSAPEIRRRRKRLPFGGCKWAEAPDVNNNLHVLPMRGRGPGWGPGGSRHMSVIGELTKTGTALRRYCEEHRARLLVLDPVSLALAVEENSRPLVSVALESWAGWATETGCAVLLTGHPSKTPDGEGSDYSGSTAWRGLVRSLWTLKPLKKEKPNKNNPNAPEEEEEEEETRDHCADLTLNKANYAKAGTVLHLVTFGEGAAWHLLDRPPKAPPAKKKEKKGGKVKPK